MVFLNVTTNGTSIQYFNGHILLGQVTAPQGAMSFAGLLFPDPVVTRVVVTLGTGEIFELRRQHAIAGSVRPAIWSRATTWPWPSPRPARGAAAATAGVPVTAVLDTFTESNADASPTALIDWGDGARSAGTIVPGPGGTFLVAGNHAYAHTGSFLADVTVDDSSGPEQTREIEIAGRAAHDHDRTDVLSLRGRGVRQHDLHGHSLGRRRRGRDRARRAGLVQPRRLPVPRSPRTERASSGRPRSPACRRARCCSRPDSCPRARRTIAAAYAGDGAHTASIATTSVGVRAQRCTLKALTRRLRPRRPRACS